MSSNSSDTESSKNNAASLAVTEEEAMRHRPPETDLIDLYSGSVDNWDDPWDGDLTEEEAAGMGVQIEVVVRWWGFELHCNEAAVRIIERVRRTIFSTVRRALPPVVSQLVAIYLRLRAVIVRRMSRGHGLRFISPWIAPLMLTPRPLPGPGQPDPPVVDDQKMRWTVFDPRNMASGPWTDPELFPAHHSAASPALAEYQGKLYCVYRGPDGDHSLYWTTYTPDDGWSEEARLPRFDHRSSTGPALAVYRGELHCFYVQDSGPGQQRLFGARFSGGTWHAPHFTFIETIVTQSSPSLVVANDQLFCFFHNFFENSHQLQYVVLEGLYFRLRQRTPVLNVTSAPAAVAFQNRIVCVWASQDRSNIFGSAFDPRTGILSNQGVRFEGQFTNIKPALVVYEGQMYCVHRGLHDQRLWWGTIQLSGSPLMPQPSGVVAFPPVHESLVEPGLVAYQDPNMYGYQGPQLMAVYRGTRR